jgi:2-polyprenyl-3-methyl-5-hydroxy-6-metoxy-1,4-benzoquinol methylase
MAMKLFLKTKDFSVSGESFELHKDAEFDMLVTRPIPENLARYYESEDYISHTDAKKSFTDKIYQKVKRVNLKNKVQLIDNQTNKEKKILDIGAGTGDFLAMAKSQGFVVEGVEPSEVARTNAIKKGVQLHADLDALNGQRFNVITLWHVLEHLPDLDKQIERMVSFLEENGTLIIAVPNYNSFDAKHYKSFWAGYDVPRHLWHFSRKSISTLFQRHDMKVAKTKPMWFDAFYVSLLSEKYKGNPLYLMSAFFVGLWSNISACFNKEYSSIIYIIKRAN